MRFGIKTRKERDDTFFEKRLLALLNRRIEVDVLGCFVDSLRGEVSLTPFRVTAIALDSSAFLRLSMHPRSADVVDYLKLNHSAPTILPGQAVQEFWNNQFAVVQSISVSMKKNFEEIKRYVDQMDEDFGDFGTKFDGIMGEFSQRYEYIYDPALSRKLLSFLEALREFAIVTFAPRLGLGDLAIQRKKSKTPPGFMDEKDGDFYIWVDLMFGLDLARRSGRDFAGVVLVTNDKKKDWSRASVAHPVLSSEMAALFQVPLQIWSTDRLVKEVTDLIDAAA